MKRKKSLLVLVLASLGAVAAFAQTDPFFPMNASTIGKGGAFTADAEGYGAFFYNPAGFAGKNQFTLASIDIYSIMDRRMFESMWKSIVKKTALDLSSFTSSGASGFTETSTALEPYITALNTAKTANATQFALNLQNNKASYSQYLKSGADLSTVSSGGDIIAQLDPKVLADPATLATAIDAITTAATGTSLGAADKAALQSSYAKALNAAAALPKGNMDIGASAGIGWTGSGLGLGLFTQADVVVRSPAKVGSRDGTIFDVTGHVLNTITLEGGFGFDVTKNVKVGFGLRPTMLSYGNIDPVGLLGLVSASQGGQTFDINSIFSYVVPRGIYKTFYIGVDVGVLWKPRDDISLGAAIKDLIPYSLKYYQYSDYSSYLASWPWKGSSTTTSGDGMYYVPPWKVNLGFMWHPDFKNLKSLIDFKFNFDVFDTFGFIRYLSAGDNVDQALLTTDYNVLDFIGFGAELKLFNFSSLRAGVYKRAVTVGVGFRFLFVDLNIAGIFRDLDLSPNAAVYGFAETGISIDAAIRF